MMVYGITKEYYSQVISKMSYALIYRFSEVVLCKVELCKVDELISEKLDHQCLEARFFSPTAELHIVWQEAEERAYLIEEEREIAKEISAKIELSQWNGDQTEDIVIKKYELLATFQNKIKGKKILVVKQYLDYDQDGQAYVHLTRLMDLEGEG